ncbi:Glycosyl transferase, family 2 [Candidatus Burkholderia verschuerenii]|uniref:Glycosyl transferase, family 2 n=2 Tax=Candidatus Burkholderia verschuerenii TaxID=242163 RepID=A0A0L0MCS1_9BURK|nr:Glycosyl transferase, family 2 [Candidatus Burkholderia verschuerenii]
MLDNTLRSLGAAISELATRGGPSTVSLFLIDNGDMHERIVPPDAARVPPFVPELIQGQGNVGYGRGHNLAIERTTSRYHLILNPDIELDDDALSRALQFLDANEDIGLLTPYIRDEHGQQQFLCRRYPTVIDLFARGFLPASLRKLLTDRLNRYELRDAIDDTSVFWAPPIISGCFMLFRTDVLKKLGGFDPRYFIYFEDYDLSLRTHEIARVAYVPSVRVLHHGGDAARKGFAHIRMFMASAWKFFNRFGWKWL